MKKAFKIILISFMFLIFTFTVSANTIDLNSKGSIEITLKEGADNMIEGAQITLYHIADATNVNNNLVFSLKSQLDTCNVDLSDLTDTNLLNEISMCNIQNANKYVGTTDSNGKYNFNNLDLGLYYVEQTKNVEGYSNFDSFLVAIPKIENNKWVVDIKAKPKTDIYKVIDLTVVKKWNSHSGNIPNEVTIELYDDLELIDTIKLNKDNNWSYTFVDIKLSDKYSVKEVNVPKGYTPSYKVNDYIFTVTNTDTLAQTGQIFYPIIIFMFLGIILVLIGLKILKNEA